MTDRLSGHDQAFLADTEQPAVGALVELDPKGSRRMSIEDVAAHLAGRMHLLPRHRQIPTAIPGAAPRWVDDRTFRLEHHLRMRDTLGAVDHLHRAPFPPGRPPWDATLLAGGRWLYLRWHHAMVDGMSAIAVSRVLFDRHADVQDQLPPRWNPQPPNRHELAAHVGAEQIATAWRVAWDRAASWLDPLTRLESDVAFLDGWLDIHDRVAIGPRPNPGVSRFTTVDNRRQQRLIDVARDTPGHTEGLSAALLTAAVTDLLAARGEPLRDRLFRVMVPVAQARRHRAERLGNAAGFYLLDLPLGVPLSTVAVSAWEQMQRVKDLHSDAVGTMMEMLDVLPSHLVALLSTTSSRTIGIDAIVSYVRGPRLPLWLAGHPHQGTFSTLPTSAAVPLSFGVVGLGGRATFSLSASDGVYPELQFLATAIRHRIAVMFGTPGSLSP